MKLFTGSLAAGLALLAGAAQAQAPGRYTAASDFDAPYAVAPHAVPGPQYGAGPRYGYGPGPGLLPSIEVYAVLRDNGFSPLGIPRLRGFVYTIAVIDRGGEDGRLVIDARNGRIIRFLPSAGPSWVSRHGLSHRRPSRRRHKRRRIKSRPCRDRHGRPMLRTARCRCRRPARSPPGLRRHRSSRRQRQPPRRLTGRLTSRLKCRQPPR